MAYHPTALLVMEHRITGMKYFCKTTQLKCLSSYKGSGVYWKKHLQKHGKDITVGLLGVYYEEDRCREAALKFSNDNNVVESNEWANLIHENGFDGAPPKEMHPMYGKPSPCIGQKRPQTSAKLRGVLNPMWGKPSPMCGVPKPKGVDSPLYGRKRPEGGGKKPHPVICIDANGAETRYDSVADAGRAMNGCRTGIHQCCNGKAKTAHGYKWRYAEEIA